MVRLFPLSFCLLSSAQLFVEGSSSFDEDSMDSQLQQLREENANLKRQLADQNSHESSRRSLPTSILSSSSGIGDMLGPLKHALSLSTLGSGMFSRFDNPFGDDTLGSGDVFGSLLSHGGHDVGTASFRRSGFECRVDGDACLCMMDSSGLDQEDFEVQADSSGTISVTGTAETFVGDERDLHDPPSAPASESYDDTGSQMLLERKRKEKAHAEEKNFHAEFTLPFDPSSSMISKSVTGEGDHSQLQIRVPGRGDADCHVMAVSKSSSSSSSSSASSSSGISSSSMHSSTSFSSGMRTGAGLPSIEFPSIFAAMDLEKEG